MNRDASAHVRAFLVRRGFELSPGASGAEVAALRDEVEALRPMLIHTATMLARKESLEVEAALKRNGSNRAAIEQWARGFYPKFRERVVEAFEPAGLAVDAIAARHLGVPVRPADLAAVAEAWTSLPVTPQRASDAERAAALVDAVLAALIQPPEASHAP